MKFLQLIARFAYVTGHGLARPILSSPQQPNTAVTRVGAIKKLRKQTTSLAASVGQSTAHSPKPAGCEAGVTCRFRRASLILSGLVWSGLVWSGLVWSGVAWCTVNR